LFVAVDEGAVRIVNGERPLIWISAVKNTAPVLHYQHSPTRATKKYPLWRIHRLEGFEISVAMPTFQDLLHE
jgi:hypothetical protein